VRNLLAEPLLVAGLRRDDAPALPDAGEDESRSNRNKVHRIIQSVAALNCSEKSGFTVDVVVTVAEPSMVLPFPSIVSVLASVDVFFTLMI
jgi:hypothetical protein